MTVPEMLKKWELGLIPKDSKVVLLNPQPSIKALFDSAKTLRLEPVAKDERGESWRILFPDNREALLIFTKAGYYRGGHSHSRPETSLILQGKVRSWKISWKIPKNAFIPGYQFNVTPDGIEIIREFSAGEIMHNEAGEPHVTLALTDYWLFDFKIDTKIGEWTNTDYPPYRKLVDEQLREK